MRRLLLIFAGVCVLLSAVASAASAATSVLLGTQTVQSSGDGEPTGQAEAFPFVAATTGVAQSISAYIPGSATTLNAALYADNGGRPGSRLATSASTAAKGGGTWATATVPTTNITAGTKYWIALLGNSTLTYRDSTSSGSYAGCIAVNTPSSSKVTSFPATFPQGETYGACPVAAYVSGTAGTVTPAAPVAPTASFTFSPASPQTGQSVRFDGSGSTCAATPCSYAWQDDGPDGSGGTNWALGTGQSLAFTFQSAETKYVRLTVTDAKNKTATVEHNVVVTTASSPTPPSAPGNTTPPAISGTAQQGNSLTASSGTWSGSPTLYAYQWQDCDSSGANCASVSGATATTYQLASGDVGHTIRVRVTATNTAGSTAASSQQTAMTASSPAPAPSLPAATAAPVVTGSTQQAQTLSTTNGSWSGTPTSYAYQWQDCDSSGASCANISGATSTSYTLGSGDVGHTIRSVVTASNAAGSTPASSTATAVVSAASTGCTTTASTASQIQSAVSTASDGDVVCVAAGTYSGFNLTRTGSHSSNVTVEPVVGSDPNAAGKVTINAGATDSGGHSAAVDFRPGTNHVTLHGFYVTSTVNVEPGDSYITIDHNNITDTTGGWFGEGINVGSVDCSAPNAPSYSGCTSVAAVSYLTISGNKIHGFGSGTEDAIHLNNWQHVHITGNELYNLEEAGNHTDNLQSVWGGADITFDHNYEHDSQAQGFFLSNGDVVGATVVDNLMVRQNNQGLGEVQIQIGNTHNVIVENNTVWADTGSNATRAYDNPPSSCSGDPYCSTSMYNATVDHNVMERFGNYQSGDPAHVALTENNNIFQQGCTTFTQSATDTNNSNPGFVNPSTDDYRLASNPNHVGIDWSPTTQHYGP